MLAFATHVHTPRASGGSPIAAAHQACPIGLVYLSAAPPVVVVQLHQHLLHFCFQQLRKYTSFGALYIHLIKVVWRPKCPSRFWMECSVKS